MCLTKDCILFFLYLTQNIQHTELQISLFWLTVYSCFTSYLCVFKPEHHHRGETAHGRQSQQNNEAAVSTNQQTYLPSFCIASRIEIC